jgi:toxin YoeB
MRDIRFTPIAFEQYNEWLSINKIIYTRLQKLIIETARTPFEGIGKPEPLKHELKGFWSRRINDEHRLVYAVEPDFIVIIACRMHYEN